MRVQLLVSNIIVAYTYLLIHKITHERYYGVRYQGICESHTPEDDLWINYYSSSKEVQKLIEEHGVDSFDYEVRRTFTTVESAIAYEHKVLRRLNVINKSNWLNKSDNKAIDRASSQKGARLAHITQRQNGHYDAMSKKGVAIKRQKLLLGECVPGGKPFGFKDSAATRKKKSLAQSGKRNSQYGTRWITNSETLTNKKISRADPIPDGWLPGRITTKHAKELAET